MAGSASSSSLPADVFLSFRGEDTRKSFVCHLHAALERQPVNAYIDSQDLTKGDNLSDLLDAITNSKLSIVVFSENYASSTWCLKELVQILKCKAEKKQIVVPVFYHVDPSHVRKQEGSFAQAFAKHERNDDLLQEVKTWRSALTEATNSSGWDSRIYKDDAELIKHIVEDVSEKLIRISPSKANDDLVGMDSHLDKMRLQLCLSIDDVRVVGIWGMGGIGKTTIAKAVYDEIGQEFHHSCFLGNVREGFAKSGEERMKEKLVDGLGALKRLGNRKVLLVLDDVDNFNQIYTLIGKKPSFGGGSRIIVTTRDSHVLNGFEMKRFTYKPKLLSNDEALGLFRRHAFGPNEPSREYDDLSSRAIRYAHGLPLAVVVLGGFLKSRSVFEWEDELEKLKENPNSGIQNVLRTSVDALDPFQKNIFLDIACFFKGMHKKYVEIILDRCGFHARIGLTVLADRALVTISKFGGLQMHDLLQELGREIVHSESPKKPWKRTRLWSYKDVRDVLTQNKATKVEGIMFELASSEDICLDAKAFVSMTNLRLIRIINPLDKPIRNCFEGESWPQQSFRPSHRTLHLNGNPKFLSHKLRVLAWHGCPLKSLSSNFDPKNLVDLDMRFSDIEQLWEETKPAKKLINIDLSFSKYFNKIPDLSEATNLEKLILKGCTSLLEVHPSISALENLVILNLESCSKLKILPSSIHLKSLKFLNLGSCSELEMFPEISEDMEALSELELRGTAIKELPSSIERLRGLESLGMEHCSSLVCLPDSICNLTKLKFLNLQRCSKLQNLPENIGSLESLLKLEVNHSGLEQLPVSILRLKLSRFDFGSCEQMVAPLSSWPSSIEDCCTVVAHLDFSCPNLLELSDAIAHFSALKTLKLSRTKLESLPLSMNGLACLEQLELDHCERLKSIPELSSSISYINADYCTALETVSTPKRPKDMGRFFTFSNCSQLVQNDIFRDIVKTHFPPQGNYSQPFYTCFPGSEIPGQFNHQCRGSSVTAQLPRNWFNKKFLGFAICAATKKLDVDYDKLSVRCLCTFKGDHCEYRFSFYLFHTKHVRRLKSNHMFVGYVPWSEFGINGEEVNERCYTVAKFEIERSPDHWSGKRIKRRGSCIKRFGVQFFFANNEEVTHHDFGEPMVHSEEGSSAEPSGSAIRSDTSDVDEQYLQYFEVLGGANINSTESDESDFEIEDNDSSGMRENLSRWTQQVRVPSGLMHGFRWKNTAVLAGSSAIRSDTSDVDERYLKLTKIFGGAVEIEDNDSSGKREVLSRWTQQVRVASGLMQGDLNDGFRWKNTAFLPGSSYQYDCPGGPSCLAQSLLKISIDDPTFVDVTYIGRHTCWETMPMFTHQVRATPGRELEGPFDGFSWGKCGQMDLPRAENPIVCYVCTPQNVQGCMAIKEVQRSNYDPTVLKITYRGRHTCMIS